MTLICFLLSAYFLWNSSTHIFYSSMSELMYKSLTTAVYTVRAWFPDAFVITSLFKLIHQLPRHIYEMIGNLTADKLDARGRLSEMFPGRSLMMTTISGSWDDQTFKNASQFPHISRPDIIQHAAQYA